MAKSSAEIGEWARRVVALVKAGGQSEWSEVELKYLWPKAEKSFRKLAGMANAAGSAPILWLIGVEEETGKVTTPKNMELADWWPQVQALFAGAPPAMREVAVEIDGETIMALCFETDAAPYVVKLLGSQHQNEVPFLRANERDVEEEPSAEVTMREGTTLRSATRADLLRILKPAARIPHLTPTVGHVTVEVRRGAPMDALAVDVTVAARFYVVPPGGENSTLDNRASRIELTDPSTGNQWTGPLAASIGGVRPVTPMVPITQATEIYCKARPLAGPANGPAGDQLELVLRVQFIEAAPARIRISLTRSGDAWTFRQAAAS